MNQIFGQRFIIFGKLRYRDQLLLKLWASPSKLLLHFIEYRLDQLNSKHTKAAVSSTIQYFEGHSQEKCLLKVWSFCTTKWWPCKTFGKLNGNHYFMANIFKLLEYQTFGLMKMHNICKVWFANKLFSLLRWNKKYFKGFQLREIVSDLRLPLYLHWILKEDFCVTSPKKLRTVISWDIVARIFSYY